MFEALAIFPNKLKAHVYGWQDFSKSCDVILIFPGLPNYPEKEFFRSLPEELHGFTFVVVYYYGYWFSGGKLTVDSSSQTVVDAVDALLNGNSIDAFSCQKLLPSVKSLSLLGYSFGASPLVRAINNLSGYMKYINKIFFVSPLGLIHKRQLTHVNKSILSRFYSYNLEFLQFLFRGYDRILQMSSKYEWRKFFSGDLITTLIDKPIGSLNKKIRIYHGAEDRLLHRSIVESFAKVLGVKNIKIVDKTGHNKSLIQKALLDEMVSQ